MTDWKLTPIARYDTQLNCLRFGDVMPSPVARMELSGILERHRNKQYYGDSFLTPLLYHLGCFETALMVAK